MDKEELYEKVIELMERVRELEAKDIERRVLSEELLRTNQRRKELDDMKNQLSWANAILDNYDVENQSLRKENDRLRKELSEHDRGPKPMRFLGAFLEENGITPEECAELCGVHPTTIKRVSKGYRCTKSTFDKVVHGLGLTADQATELRKSLTKKQKRYDRKK